MVLIGVASAHVAPLSVEVDEDTTRCGDAASPKLLPAIISTTGVPLPEWLLAPTKAMDGSPIPCVRLSVTGSGGQLF